MSKGSEPTMRDEYDFSTAVRSRHAARLSEDDRRELRKRAAAQDVQAWVTHALHRVQVLEGDIVAYVALAWEEPPHDAGTKVAAVLERADPSTWDRLLRDFQEQGILGPEFESRLQHLMKERNWLVHRSGYEIQEALSQPQGVPPLVERLQALVDDANVLSEKLWSILEQRLSRIGLSSQEIVRERDHLIERWLAA